MDENARTIIQKQGRIYTEALLSAAMEAGFDLKAVPAVMLGGGASVIQRLSLIHISSLEIRPSAPLGG